MNWLTKPVVIFLVVTNLLFIQSSFCQNTDLIVVFSDQQFAKGNFGLAANEYNRALFFGYHAPDELCLKIANCYINLNKPDLSALFFDRAYFSGVSDSIKTEAIIGKSFSLILDKQYMLALSELMNLDSAKIAEQDIKLNFLKGIAYFGLNQDELAEVAFKKSVSKSSGINSAYDIEKEFQQIKKSEKRFNPHTAWLLSLLVPGTGQAYAGDYKEAANSAFLLGGIIYLATTFAAKYSALEAIVIILPWFQRYYMGGANKAERLAIEKQERKRNDSYQRILSKIEMANQQKTLN
jgi:hypothetical protein